MHGRARSAPHPLPLLRWRSRGGEGGEAGKSCPAWGILSREGGISGKWIWRVIFAGGFGVFPWQDILAGLLGGSVWRVKSAHSFSGFQSKKKNMLLNKKRNRMERNVLCWICRLWYHYIASNIVLFAFVAGSPEPANCGLTTVVMWICESHCE